MRRKRNPGSGASSRGASYLDLRPSDPTDRRQVVLKQQMIRLIIEAPLTNSQVSTSFFNLGGKNATIMFMKSKYCLC